MSTELVQFLTTHGTVLILAAAALAALAIIQWRKYRVAEEELALKTEWLGHGMTVGEIEKLLATRAPGRKGLLDQFGALSGGVKAGLIVGFVIVATVTVSVICGTIQSNAFWNSVRQQQTAPPGWPATGASLPAPAGDGAAVGQVFYIDLQPAANQKLDGPISGEEGNSLAALPRGRQELGGIPFQVGTGFIRLKGKNRPDLPGEVKDLRVGLTLDRLHFLQGAEFGDKEPYLEKEGTEIGRYRVQYADGSFQTIPIVYGEDVRDSWKWDGAKVIKRGQVAWTGGNPAAQRYGVSLRLYRTTWENPKPGSEITRLDFSSAGGTAASPFCVAITAERKWR